MVIVQKAKWQEHSRYKGVPIFKRQTSTGTSGGQWLAVMVNCKSLAQAQKAIDFEEECGNLKGWQNWLS